MVSQTLAQTRQECWIPQGCALIKKTLKNCQICKKIEEISFVMPEMPPLPQERVARSLPFEFTDLDYFGLLYIKQFEQASKSPRPSPGPPRLSHKNKDVKSKKRMLCQYLRAQMNSEPTTLRPKFGLGITCN